MLFHNLDFRQAFLWLPQQMGSSKSFLSMMVIKWRKASSCSNLFWLVGLLFSFLWKCRGMVVWIIQHVAMLMLTSPTDIMPTRSTLVLGTKDSTVSLITNLNDKNNVCKQCCLCIVHYWISCEFFGFMSKTQPFHLVFSSDKDLQPSSNVRLFIPNLIPSIKYLNKIDR